MREYHLLFFRESTKTEYYSKWLAEDDDHMLESLNNDPECLKAIEPEGEVWELLGFISRRLPAPPEC